MNLYLSREGQTFGPYTVDQAREYLAAGQFLPNDYALFEGQIEWKSLGELIGTETSQPEAEPDLAVVEPTREEVQEVAEATGLEHRSPGEVQPQKNPQSSDSNRKRPKKIGGRNKGRSVVAKPQRRSLSSKIISTLVVFLITALVFGGIVTGLYFVMPEKVAPLLASLGLPVGEEKNEQEFKHNIESILSTAKNHNMMICLETDLEPDRFLRLLMDINHPNVKINYDIGNSTSNGYDPEIELSLLKSWIMNIHVKDRLNYGNTVPLGNGNVDFGQFFSLIKKINYSYDLIIQGAREDLIDISILPEETCSKYFKFVMQYLDK